MSQASYSSVLLRNGRGIPGVHVALYNLNNVKVTATTTEGTIIEGDDKVDGKFAFKNITPGQYQLRFFGEGFTEDDFETINIAGDAVELDKELLLQSLVERESSLVWSSRAFIDIFTDSTSEIRDASTLTSAVDNGALSLPSTTQVGVGYLYRTNTTDIKSGDVTISGVQIATLYADYIQGNGNIKIETTFDNGSNFYTWLDTSAGIDRLKQQKEATSDFVDGTDVQIRVTLQPGSDNTGSQLNHIALYTGPNLFE